MKQVQVKQSVQRLGRTPANSEDRRISMTSERYQNMLHWCACANEREQTENRVSHMHRQHQSHKSGSVGAAPAVRCSRRRVEVRSRSLKLWGLTLASYAFKRLLLVRAHHKTPHSGNNERSRPKTHAVEAQWQRVLTTEAQHVYSLQLPRHTTNVEQHEQANRGIQNIGFGRFRVRSKKRF